MLLTLIASLIALAGGILLLRFGAAFTDFPSFAPTLGVMLGLGAGIDYALLIVGRYREQLAAGDTRRAQRPRRQRHGRARASSRRARSSSSRSPACSPPASRSSGRMGVGSAIVVATVAVGAVTVLPTLMGAFAAPPAPEEPETVAPRKAFERWAHADHRAARAPRPSPARVLLALAAPVLGLRLGMPDDGNDAGGTTTRVAYDRLAEGFGVGFNGPLVLATDRTGAARSRSSDGGREHARRRVRLRARALARSSDAATLTVIPTTSPQDPRTSELVTRLRDELPARRLRRRRGRDARRHGGQDRRRGCRSSSRS